MAKDFISMWSRKRKR